MKDWLDRVIKAMQNLLFDCPFEQTVMVILLIVSIVLFQSLEYYLDYRP